MNPELKAYLDEWQARQQHIFDNHMASMDALHRSMLHTSDCFFAPVTASSDAAELAIASVGLVEPSAPVLIVAEVPIVDAASPAIAKEGPEGVLSASTSFITAATVTCSTVCLPRHPVAMPALVASSPPTPTEYGLYTNNIPRLDIKGVLASVESNHQAHGTRKIVDTGSNIQVSSDMPFDPGRKLQSHLQALVALPLASSELCLISGGWGNHETLNLDTICNIIPTTDTPWSCKDGVPVEDNVRDDPLEAWNEEAAAVDLAAEHVISGLSNEGFNMLFVQAGGEEHDLQVLAWPTFLHFVGCMMASIFTRRILPADVHIELSEFTTGLSVLVIQLFEAVRWAVEDATIHTMSIGRFFGQEPLSFVIDSQVLPLHLTTLMNTALEVHTVAAPKAGPTISEREFELLPLSSLDMQCLGFMSVDEEDAMEAIFTPSVRRMLAVSGSDLDSVSDGLFPQETATSDAAIFGSTPYFKGSESVTEPVELTVFADALSTAPVSEAVSFVVGTASGDAKASVSRVHGRGRKVNTPVVKTLQFCNNAEPVPAYLLPNDMPHHEKIQWPPWPPPWFIWNIHKGHMFRSRLFSSFECNQDGIPYATRLFQSWLGPSSKPKTCEHSPGSNHMQAKQVSDSATRHIDHIILQSDGIEIYQSLTQPEEYLILGLQPKPPWLSSLTKIDPKVEEVVVHPHGEEIAYVQLIWFKLLLLRPHSELPIDICLHELQLTSRGMKAGFHSCQSASRPLVQAQEIPPNKRKMEVLDMELLRLSDIAVFRGYGGTRQTHEVQSTGGCIFALYSSDKRWTDRMHCYAHLDWSSLQLAGAFQIWLVAWTVDGLEFFMGQGQAPFQGGRNVSRAALFDHVQVSHDDYTTCTNQILFDYDYYLNQAYYFDKVCNDIISYREDYHGNYNKTTKIHMPWDPGKLVSRYFLKFRLGDKPSFKEGGMLGPSPTRAGTVGHHMGLAHPQKLVTTSTQEGATIWASGWIMETAPAAPSSHPWL